MLNKWLGQAYKYIQYTQKYTEQTNKQVNNILIEFAFCSGCFMGGGKIAIFGISDVIHQLNNSDSVRIHPVGSRPVCVQCRQ